MLESVLDDIEHEDRKIVLNPCQQIVVVFRFVVPKKVLETWVVMW